MVNDLKIIKKEYGEKMAHLCRDLFPIILETPGLLSKIIISKFSRNHFLYDDLIENDMIEEFKNYIYSLIDIENESEKEINKSVKELLEEAGYDFYECKTENDIQSFRKYYSIGEELCTFNKNRLEKCYVYFCVKKNVDEIKREDFNIPKRQDEYGTSVISIQITRNSHTLSIKNRYNHTVDNPDATFSNNLENIIPGLTQAFEKEYNFKINQNVYEKFELDKYVFADDGKYYRYNYEFDNIYFCPNNIIINQGKVIQYDKSRYLLIDYFLFDLKEKKMEDFYILNDDPINNIMSDIENIKIIKENNNKKQIIIKQNNYKEEVKIIIDKYNRIIEYTNNNIIELPRNFMWLLKYLEKVEVKKVINMEDYAFMNAFNLIELIAPNVKYIGNYVLIDNKCLKILNLPRLLEIGNFFLKNNKSLEILDTPNLIKFGNCLLWENTYKLKKVDCSINLSGS